MKLVMTCTIILVLCGAGLVASFEIQAWERANNYPYGKLCDVFRNCR